MSDPYLCDKLRGLLKMVVWYGKANNQKQKDKVWTAAMQHIGDAGEIHDTELVRVLKAYAEEFAQCGLRDEAEKLEKIVASTKELLPNLYSADGRELEWWEQPAFVSRVPDLPWEIRASRVQPGPGGGLGGILTISFAVFLVLGIFYGLILYPIFIALKIDDGILGILFLLSGPSGAWMMYRLRESGLERKGSESWCRMNEDGIEFHEPGKSGRIRWSEIKDVYSLSDSSPDEDSPYDVTEIQGRNGKKIRLSAQFYTDQEVRTAFGICMLRQDSKSRYLQAEL